MDAKTKGIVAHLTLIGWIVVLVMNQGDKRDELASFYLRQMLGVMLMGLVISALSMLGISWTILGFLNLIVFVAWVISFIYSLSGEKKLLPYVGEFFQKTFQGV